MTRDRDQVVKSTGGRHSRSPPRHPDRLLAAAADRVRGTASAIVTPAASRGSTAPGAQLDSELGTALSPRTPIQPRNPVSRPIGPGC